MTWSFFLNFCVCLCSKNSVSFCKLYCGSSFLKTIWNQYSLKSFQAILNFDHIITGYVTFFSEKIYQMYLLFLWCSYRHINTQTCVLFCFCFKHLTHVCLWLSTSWGLTSPGWCTLHPSSAPCPPLYWDWSHTERWPSLPRVRLQALEAGQAAAERTSPVTTAVGSRVRHTGGQWIWERSTGSVPLRGSEEEASWILCVGIV